MKRVRLKQYSYHTFLVVPFMVLFLFGHNPRQTSVDMVWRPLVLGLAGSALVFALFYLFFRSRLKTGVFVTLLLFALFQYGTWYEFLERLYYAGHWPFSNIHRYLLAFFLLGLAAIFLVIRFSKHDFIRINYFLNVLLLMLVLYNMLRISTRGTATYAETEHPGHTNESIALHDSTPKKNIYFIVLDGYASNNVLKKFYGFDNAAFTSRLRDLGFSFADSAVANRYYTSHSLCATLNMDLRVPPARVNERLEDNRVMRTMSDNGYKVYYLSSGYAVTSNFRYADSCVPINGPNEFEKSLLRHTILRLDDLVGFFARQRLSSQFTQMGRMGDIGASPKFCFMHIVAPHPPYVFDRRGRLRARHRFAEHSWEPKEHYIEQLEHVNKLVGDFIAGLRRKDPDALILLQSDHGPWVSASSAEAVFEARSQVLYAWYNPAEIPIPQKSSTVNTFRYVLNALYRTGLPLLNDSLAGKEALLRDPILLKKVKL